MEVDKGNSIETGGYSVVAVRPDLVIGDDTAVHFVIAGANVAPRGRVIPGAVVEGLPDTMAAHDVRERIKEVWRAENSPCNDVAVADLLKRVGDELTDVVQA